MQQYQIKMNFDASCLFVCANTYKHLSFKIKSQSKNTFLKIILDKKWKVTQI